MKYIKELDSIRAIAVLLVIISHWIPPNIPINILPNGPIGVNIFFVLSGFLITWILLENRKKAEETEIGKGTILKNFYIRRLLRIFPIYYLVVFALYIFHESSGTQIKTALPYYLTYTSNFHFYYINQWDGILSHLWSLAVEEQFYLLWPSIMLFVPKRYLIHIIWGFMIIGMGSSIMVWQQPMGTTLTWTCFDAFGMGALLAWHLVYKPEGIARMYRVLKVAVLIACAFLVAIAIDKSGALTRIFTRPASGIIALFAITYIIRKKPEGILKLNFIWSNKVLIFIGKISYGIYLYHNLIPWYTSKAFQKFMGYQLETALPYKLGYVLMLGVNAVILLVLAWGSWILIEKPVLSLKKYFNYDEKVKPVPAASLVNEPISR